MRRDGKSLDDIYTRLIEEGYPLPPMEMGSAEQLVIAAIQDELSGRPMRQPGAMNEQLANTKAEFDELTDILQQSGLDWQNMPSEEVAKQLGIAGLAQAASEAQGTDNVAYFQEQYGATMAVIHNISEYNLRKVLELGGLPAPSIAVVDTRHDAFEGYR